MNEEREVDDVVLGTALARSIESMVVRETPFERSRLAARIAERRRAFPFAALAAAAAVVLAIGLTALLVAPRGTPAEEAISAPSSTPSAAATPVESAVPVAVPPVPTSVYFARVGLPPLAATVLGTGGGRDLPEDRIGSRITALWGAQQPPPASFNAFAKAGRSGSGGQLGTSVRVDGDLAIVTFTVSNWGATNPTEGRALVQQLVYTITEEPGIRRALIAEEHKPNAVIGGVTVDKPVTREDVMGYSFLGTKTPSIVSDGTQVAQDVIGWSVLNEQTPGLGRFVVDLRARSAVPAGRLDPRFSAKLVACASCGGTDGKWWIVLDLLDAQPPTSRSQLGQQPTGGPIRAVSGPSVIDSGPQGLPLPYASYSIKIDDARSWRVAVEPTGTGTVRLYVDVGGRPSSVNENIAVYVPVPEQGAGDRAAGCTCKISGAARVFEATVAWRVRDGNGREISQGHTNASLGTSVVWGLFETTITIPPNAAGTPTLEVFWVSPKDGSEQDVVRIPLTLH